jgi:hypothetical protein
MIKMLLPNFRNKFDHKQIKIKEKRIWRKKKLSTWHVTIFNQLQSGRNQIRLFITIGDLVKNLSICLTIVTFQKD